MATPWKYRVNRIVRRRGMILRIPLGGEAGLPTRRHPPRVRADTRPYTSPHAPIPKLIHRAAGRRGRAVDRGRPRGRGLQPRQGALPQGRPHQARPGALLPGRGRRRAARRRRTTQRDGPLSQRHRRRALLPEARAGVASALDRGGHAQVPLGTERRGGGAARRGRAGVARQPRLPRAAPAPGPGGRPRPSRRAAGGSRPGTRREWDQVRQVARVVDEALGELGLTGWPKTSGSRGLHVIVRIERRWTFDQVRRAALALARDVERRAPALATSKWWKEERHGVFVDYNQNAKDRTVASAYSVRPRPTRGCPLPSAGMSWRSAIPREFTLATMPARFAAAGDPHAAIDEHADRSTRCWSCRRGTRRRAWATPPGRRTTRSSRASRRGCSRPRSRSPRVEASADRDRPRAPQGGRAGGAGAMEGAPPRGGGTPGAGGRAGGRDAGPLVHLDPDPGEPAARARRAPAGSGAAGPGREDLGQLVGRGDLELVVAAVLAAACPTASGGRRRRGGSGRPAGGRTSLRTPARRGAAPRRGPSPRSSGSGRQASGSIPFASASAQLRQGCPSSASSRSGASSFTSSFRFAMVNDEVTPTCCSTPRAS